MLTPILRALAATLTATLALAAHAEPPSPPPVPSLAPPLSFDEESDDFDACITACIAKSPKTGELLCLDRRFATNCGPGHCRAAWVKPGKPVTAFTDLTECLGRNFGVKPRQVNAVNAKAKTLAVTPVSPVFAHGPFDSIPTDAPITATHDGVTFTLDYYNLTVSRGGVVVDEISWHPAEGTLPFDASATVRVYPSGKHFLAVIAYTTASSHYGVDIYRNRWVMLGAPRDRALDPAPMFPYDDLQALCPPDGTCPPQYAKVATYLDAVCDGTITSNEIESLRAAARSNDGFDDFPRLDELKLLLNVHGAMYGYKFRVEPWLNDFFYGAGTWLPPACKPLIRAYPNQKSVPASHTRMRASMKALWDSVQQKAR